MTMHPALRAVAVASVLIAPFAHAAEPPSVAALQREVDALRAEVAALREEIRAQHAASTKTDSTVATLQAETATAAQTAVTASARADAATSASARTDKALSAQSWAANTKIGALVFFNVSHIDQRAGGVAQSANGTGINLKRIHVSVEHTFNTIFSANITTDASNVIGEPLNANYYNTPTGVAPATPTTVIGKGFFVKKVYLQAKLDPALTLRIGESEQPWIPFMEGVYGHRYIDPVLPDQYKLGQAIDWGVQAFGDLADGHLSYQIGVINGAGFRTVNVTKSVDVEARVSARFGGWFAAVGGYSGRLGKQAEGVAVAHTAQRFDAALGYKVDRFTLGGEYLYAKNFNSVTLASEDTNTGWSGFGSYTVTPRWQVFGRYDWIRQTPKVASGASVTSRYYNLGVQWEPVKLVDLSLVYKRDAVTNLGTVSGLIAQQNGTGLLGGVNGGTYDEFGLFGQFKF